MEPQDTPQNADNPNTDARRTKLCFVTIGATAGFNSLVREVLTAPFLAALAANNYTDLMVQHGRNAETLFTDWKAVNGLAVEQTYGVYVTGFPYNLDGLGEELRAVKKDGSSRREEGVVISHAGTGTILEALRYGIPLVVVPNPDLMHNHQAELAKQLETVGWVIHGRIGNLSSAIDATESFRNRLHTWPPASRFDQNGIQSTMDDELGFVD